LVEKRMTRFSSSPARRVGIAFLVTALVWALAFFAFGRSNAPWPARWVLGVIGVSFLIVAVTWLIEEWWLSRRIRAVSNLAQRLGAGEWTARTGIETAPGEIGKLAESLDRLAISLQRKLEERDNREKSLLERSFQQTVVGALGQFALVSSDFSALLNQAVMLVSQTLEVEFCGILELESNRHDLILRAGVGWKEGSVDRTRLRADPRFQYGFTLRAGEPVVVENWKQEYRFRPCSLLRDHQVSAGITVAIIGHGCAYGLLGAHTTLSRKFSEDEVHFLLAVANVLAMAAARKLAESDLEKLAAFVQLNPNPVLELVRDGTPTYCNDAASRLASSVGQQDPRTILPPNVRSIVNNCLQKGESCTNHEVQIDGKTFAWSFHPVNGRQVVHAYVENITDRLSLEAQLRQSQKMESVGLLAAGVAHDFNNMLTIIQGHSGMVLSKASENPGLMESTQAIYFAAERAASLTRQLLMFSRKNVMQPRKLDLRETVSQMGKMLQRLLGETITLRFQPPPRLPYVLADVGMIEQVIMNLAVNARDAMPKGGTLTITTAAVTVNQSYAQSHPDARPGSFMCLRVSDTGCGMDEYTIGRIFEPFFTTKEVGKGTGLGLATVYGIVKQHGGWVEVASEVGRGTAFSVFFPTVGDPIPAVSLAPVAATEIRGGNETILIVEDEPVLRDMAHIILEDRGYTILEASSGRDALDVWNQHKEKIDLVLTDMVMPEGISGMDLAHRLLEVQPELKVIFASGYTMDDLDPTFVRERQAMFLQKPYTHLSLAQAVRDCLDGKSAPLPAAAGV
jgi:signal transduction histidine kinase/CheY-like chemotaxis protein/HAMP domain-containing protein